MPAIEAPKTEWPLDGEAPVPDPADGANTVFRWVSPDMTTVTKVPLPRRMVGGSKDPDADLVMRNVRGDGNCFFHALAYLIPRPTFLPRGVRNWRFKDVASGINGLRLRELVLEHLLKPGHEQFYFDAHPKTGIPNFNRDTTTGFAIKEGEAPRQTLTRYKKHMLRPMKTTAGTTWEMADDLCVEAAAELLQAVVLTVMISDYDRPKLKPGEKQPPPRYHPKWAQIVAQAWPSRKDEYGDYVVVNGSYVSVTEDEARSLPVYMVVLHNKLGTPHYEALTFNRFLPSLEDGAKSSDVVGGSSAAERNEAQCELYSMELLREARVPEGLREQREKERCTLCDWLKAHDIAPEDEQDLQALRELKGAVLLSMGHLEDPERGEKRSAGGSESPGPKAPRSGSAMHS